MRCVECGAPVSVTYRTHPTGAVKLARCGACGKFADEYVEYDLTIVVLDMILYKAPAYRHLVFNRLPGAERSIVTGMPRAFDFLCATFLGLDAYVNLLTHLCAEGSLASLQLKCTYHILATHWDKGLYFLLLTGLTYAAHLLGVSLVVFLTPPRGRQPPPGGPAYVTPPAPRPYPASPISPKDPHSGPLPSTPIPPPPQAFTVVDVATSLLLASYGKSLLMLLLVWEYPVYFTVLAECIVFSGQLLGLRVCLSLPPGPALLAVGVGFLFAWAVRAAGWAAPSIVCPVLGPIP